MTFLNLYGNPVQINIKPYLVDWDKEIGSKLQYSVKCALKPIWKHLIVLEEFRIPSSLYRCDLLCPARRICIEISPEKVHTKYNPFFHKNRPNFLKKIKADADKRTWCEQNGFTLLELDDSDIKNFSPSYIKDKFGIIL